MNRANSLNLIIQVCIVVSLKSLCYLCLIGPVAIHVSLTHANVGVKIFFIVKLFVS